ncbi:MAG: hypothetical protein ACOCXG_05785, partial [Nanoarchaeota archaeon]
SMSKMLSMIPGLGGLKIPKEQMAAQEENLKKWKYIMDSMTKYEKRNPEVIDVSRVKRVADGSGTNVSDVRNLLKHFKQTKKMMTMMKNPEDLDMENMDPQQMMKMMKKSGVKNMKQMMKGGLK